MQIQSLSVCVPGGCPNDCKFCVSKMKRDEYTNQIEGNKAFRHLYKEDFKTRLKFARDNGCNTVILTGDSEPISNRRFLEDFFEWNQHLPNPFRWIELQTSGVGLVDSNTHDQPVLRWLRNSGVTSISLSLSSLTDNINWNYNGTPEKLRFRISEVCDQIKRYDFNLRLSLNMTDCFDQTVPKNIFDRAKQLEANQITFRVLYTSGDSQLDQNIWIEQHRAKDETIMAISEYIRAYGRKLERLPFGSVRYSVKGMSVVVDDDCMSMAEDKETIRYMVLRPDCKLYSKWDDKGSLIF